MKKFISMVMAAAMVVSLVPATAFAAGEVSATAKVVDAWEKKVGEFDGVVSGTNVPEVQLTVTGVDYQKTYDELPTVDVELKLGNANWNDVSDEVFKSYVEVTRGGASVLGTGETVSGAADAVVTVIGGTAATHRYNPATKALVEIPASVKEDTPAVTVAEQKAALVADGYELVTLLDAKEYYVKYNANGAITDKVLASSIEEIPAKTAVQNIDAWALANGMGRGWQYVTVTTPAVPGTPVVSNDKAVYIKDVEVDDDLEELTITFAGFFEKDDIISVDLISLMDKTGEGRVATVSVDSDMVEAKDLIYVSVLGKVLKASIDDVVEVAEEEIVALDEDGLVIEAAVGTLPEVVTLKLSKGFEFVGTDMGRIEDEDEIEITGVTGSKITVTGISVEATTAKSGDVATIKVVAPKWASASVEVAKVIDYKVVMELADPDDDMPVIYSGVNVANTGLNDDSDHVSLEVKLYETFAGAWDMDKAFTLSLPEGVYVTEATFVDGDLAVRPNAATGKDAIEGAFEAAYVKGDHVDFEFAKRVFVETDPDHKDVRDHASDVTFTLTLIADPGFVGDVVLTLEGAAVETQEVTIAKFVAPMTVKAEQNDVIIDYRYTEIPTDIVVTEAEAGLWDEGLLIGFEVEKAGVIEFEDDATITVNEASDMEVEKEDDTDGLVFRVTEESEEEAAVVTINGIELFMQRNIPAGPYALEMVCSAVTDYDAEVLLGQPACECSDDCVNVAEINDYSTTVKESWINVVTAGRDQDDASFTTEVVVPVGESYIVAGETQIALDVPAYINANGYTMLPVRAVATALGINNDAVQWDQATKTVIIMYGQRIITMTAGSSVVYVSGTAIPAKSAVEIVDGRAFLGLRDLATTLGVAKIAWDPATNVATLNPKA